MRLSGSSARTTARMASMDFWLAPSRFHTEIVCELNRIERLTPQMSSPARPRSISRASSIDAENENGHTLLDNLLKGLANGHQLDALPELGGISLVDPKRPASASDIPLVLPDRLHRPLEKMNRVPHDQGPQGKVVERLPEGLDVVDIYELDQVGPIRVGLLYGCRDCRGCRCWHVATASSASSLKSSMRLSPIMPKFPAMGEWWRPKLLQHRVLPVRWSDRYLGTVHLMDGVPGLAGQVLDLVEWCGHRV